MDYTKEGGIILPAKLTTTIKNTDIKVLNQTELQIKIFMNTYNT